MLSALRVYERCHESEKQNDGLDTAGLVGIHVKAAEVKWVTLGHCWGWTVSGGSKEPGMLLDLAVWQAWDVLTCWSSLSHGGCSPWLEHSRELPPFIHLQLPCLDLPQLAGQKLRSSLKDHHDLCSVASEESLWVYKTRHKPLVQDLLKWLLSFRACPAGSAELTGFLWQWHITKHHEYPQGYGLEFILPQYPDYLSRKAGLACKCDFTETWQKTEIP